VTGRASRLYKKTEWWSAGMVICLERGADLHMAQLMPLPLTVSCFSTIQIDFIFLVLPHPDVCMYVLDNQTQMLFLSQPTFEALQKSHASVPMEINVSLILNPKMNTQLLVVFDIIKCNSVYIYLAVHNKYPLIRN